MIADKIVEKLHLCSAKAKISRQNFWWNQVQFVLKYRDKSHISILFEGNYKNKQDEYFSMTTWRYKLTKDNFFTILSASYHTLVKTDMLKLFP